MKAKSRFNPRILTRGLKDFSIKALRHSFDVTNLNTILHRLQVTLFHPFIRVINYHDIPEHTAQNFEEQLLYYKEHFTPVGYEDLMALSKSEWKHTKPGLLICLDDGLRTHWEVAIPLLEKLGFVAWCFIPPQFIDIPKPKQAEYGRVNRIGWYGREQSHPGALTWEQIRKIDKNHIIGAHTYTHTRLHHALTSENLTHEIFGSKKRLEQELQHQIDAFCWVGGEEWSYGQEAAAMIKEAYKISFMNQKFVIQANSNLLQIHRICVESTDSIAHMHFLLSGFYDVLYRQERKRVNQITR